MGEADCRKKKRTLYFTRTEGLKLYTVIYWEILWRFVLEPIQFESDRKIIHSFFYEL